MKKAKLCQKTGKGERNVTNYCIAGDNINELCTEQIVQTNYPERMKQNRKQQQERASNEGRDPRSKKEYKEDLERGPCLTRNMINHAYKLLNQVQEIKKEITEEKYKEVFEKTEKMLSCLELQGTFALYNDRLEDVANSRWKEHQPNVRELESGVDVTAAVQGEILFSKIKKDDNTIQLRQECIHRNIANAPNLGWRKMIEAIQEQERQHWLADNPNKTLPDKMKKPRSFRNLSGVDFIFKDN